MLRRCYNEAHISYHLYGGRGIRVCKRWLGPHGFENFLIDMGPRPTDMTLDRKKRNLGYSPTNCRWATAKQQTDNRAATILVSYQGTKMVLKDAAIKSGVTYETVRARYHRGDRGPKLFRPTTATRGAA
jgi:hypothetical protein